jgi:hypothetical protein
MHVSKPAPRAPSRPYDGKQTDLEQEQRRSHTSVFTRLRKDDAQADSAARGQLVSHVEQDKDSSEGSPRPVASGSAAVNRLPHFARSGRDGQHGDYEPSMYSRVGFGPAYRVSGLSSRKIDSSPTPSQSLASLPDGTLTSPCLSKYAGQGEPRVEGSPGPQQWAPHAGRQRKFVRKELTLPPQETIFSKLSLAKSVGEFFWILLAAIGNLLRDLPDEHPGAFQFDDGWKCNIF